MDLVLRIILQMFLLALFVVGGYLLRFYNLKPIKYAIISGSLSIVNLLFVFICLLPAGAPIEVIRVFYYISFQLALAGFIFAMFGIKGDSRRSALGTMSEKEIRVLSSLEHSERLYGIISILCCLILMFFIGTTRAIALGKLPYFAFTPCVIYVSILAIISPIIIGIALKGYQFWNGLLSLVLLVAIMLASSLVALDGGVAPPNIFYVTLLCMFLPTLLALYSQMYDEQKVFGTVTLSVIAFLALILFYV